MLASCPKVGKRSLRTSRVYSLPNAMFACLDLVMSVVVVKIESQLAGRSCSESKQKFVVLGATFFRSEVHPGKMSWATC